MPKRKVEQSKEQIGVEVTLAPIRVSIEPTENEEVFIKRVQEAIIAEISNKMPKFQYSWVATGALTQETAYIGTLVEEISNPSKKGIITAVNAKTINVTLKGGIRIQGNASLFRKTDASFEEVATFHKNMEVTEMNIKNEPVNIASLEGLYFEGDAGYVHNNGKVFPVVVGKMAGRATKYKLFLINDKNRYFTLTEAQMKMYFKSTK